MTSIKSIYCNVINAAINAFVFIVKKVITIIKVILKWSIGAFKKEQNK